MQLANPYRIIEANITNNFVGYFPGSYIANEKINKENIVGGGIFFSHYMTINSPSVAMDKINVYWKETSSQNCPVWAILLNMR